MDTQPKSLEELSSDETIKFSHSKMSIRREKLEELAALGFSTGQTSKYFGVNRQRAWLMFERLGLNKLRNSKRQEIKDKKKTASAQLYSARQSFVDALRQLEEIVAQKSSWAEMKTWQYRNIHSRIHPKSYFDEQLIKLFEAYGVAKLEGKKLSITKLGEIAGLHFVSVGKILRDVGLDRMYWNVENRHATPKWKKEALLKSFDSSPLSAADIAHFLELPYPVVIQYLRLKKHQCVGKELIINGVGKHKLTYYRASQIYEAQDLGFNPQETSELLDLPLKRVTYVKYHRHQFGPILIKALNAMFPQESINTPYRLKK